MTKVSTAGVSTSIEPIPASIYVGTFTKYSEGPSKSTPGQKSFQALFIVKTDAEGDAEHEGRKLYMSGSLQQQALFTLKRIGVAVGVPDEVLEDKAGWDPEVVLPEYYNSDVNLRVTVDQYQGKPTNRVDVLLEGENAHVEENGKGSW